MWGDQLMLGVILTPRSVTIKLGCISVPLGVMYSKNWFENGSSVSRLDLDLE